MKKRGYEVGYGRPPKQTRFKKGKSGNPKGRSRKPRDFEQMLQAKLDQKIKVTIGNRTQMLTNMDVFTDVVIIGAHRRDRTCINILIDHLNKRRTPEPFGTTPEERDDLQRALKNFSLALEQPPFEEDDTGEERKDDNSDDDKRSE